VRSASVGPKCLSTAAAYCGSVSCMHCVAGKGHKKNGALLERSAPLYLRVQVRQPVWLPALRYLAEY